MSALEPFFSRLAELGGLSPTTAALAVGLILGFTLRSLFSRRATTTSFDPPLHASIESASATPSSLFRQRQEAASDFARHESLRQLVVDEKQLLEIRQLLKSGNKIAAIKLFREATNVGLAEAKSAIEAIERTLP